MTSQALTAHAGMRLSYAPIQLEYLAIHWPRDIDCNVIIVTIGLINQATGSQQKQEKTADIPSQKQACILGQPSTPLSRCVRENRAP